MTRSSVRLLIASSAAVASALVVTSAPATGAGTTVRSPVVSSVSPLKVKVGQRLVIKGRGFISGRNRNTVVFKRDGQRAVFVRADRATSTQITVVLPDKLAKALAQRDGRPQTTTFRIRVLSRRLARRFTPLAGSPRISPADTTPAAGGATPGASPTPAPAAPPPDCDGDTQPDDVDLDDDADLVADSQEAAFGTDRCKADSDGDGAWDHWEIQSALDLNSRANFPPAKRPWPNPNFGGDVKFDFDQDGLPARVEADLWARSGRPAELTYSDGDQSTTTSADELGQDHDAFNWLVTPETEHLNFDGDRILTDDEKDFDGDRLPNWDEWTGRMAGAWWKEAYTDESPFFEVADAQLTDARAINTSGGTPMYADADIDGDQVPDGADDQDRDGWPNAVEVWRGNVGTPRSGPAFDLDEDGTLEALLGNPYNPCLPDRNSRACTLHPPFSNAWAPFSEPPLPFVTVDPGGSADRSRPQELIPIVP